MDTRTSVRNGQFCWLELATSDFPAIQDYYQAVFGWRIPDPEGDGEMAYAHVHAGDLELGGAYRLLEDQRKQGVPSHWISYVAVEKVEDAMARAVELGGSVVFGPCEVPGAGRLAVLADPADGKFAVWQAGEHCGVAYEGTPGQPCWFELMSTDAAAAGEFYAGLFGWQLESRDMGPIGSYTLFQNGDQTVGGMVQIAPEMGPKPSHWMPYITVEDCDAAVARIQEHGGKLYAPPTDIPEVGRFAVAADPSGAVLACIRLAPQGQ